MFVFTIQNVFTICILKDGLAKNVDEIGCTELPIQIQIGQSTGWSSSKHSHDWTNRKKANTMTKWVLAPGEESIFCYNLFLSLLASWKAQLCFVSYGFLLFSSKMWRENAAKFKTNGRRTICLRCHILHYPFAKQHQLLWNKIFYDISKVYQP